LGVRATPCAGEPGVARGVLVLGIDAGDRRVDDIPADVPFLAIGRIYADPGMDGLAARVDEYGDG